MGPTGSVLLHGTVGTYWPFTFASGTNSIVMNIHGLGSAPTSLGASDSSQWAHSSTTGYPNTWSLGSLCTADGFIAGNNDPHGLIMNFVDVPMEVSAWLNSRRRLDESELTEEQ